jgi:hypothetical protein
VTCSGKNSHAVNFSTVLRHQVVRQVEMLPNRPYGRYMRFQFSGCRDDWRWLCAKNPVSTGENAVLVVLYLFFFVL